MEAKTMAKLIESGLKRRLTGKEGGGIWRRRGLEIQLSSVALSAKVFVKKRLCSQ